MESTGTSRSRGQPLLMGAVVLAVGCACHPLRPSPPSRDDRQVASQSSQLHELIDPTGRWRSQVSTLQAPKLHALPGHVRIDLMPGSPIVTNCFVYEQPILAGEATAQLLRALAPGLRWNKFSALDIEVLNQTPLVAFSLEFETTLGETERGAFDIFVFPRLEYPAMCSVETSLSAEQPPTAADQGVAERAVRQFLVNLNATQPVQVVVSELWLLKQQGKPVGFRQSRVERMGELYSTTSQSSRFSLAPEAVRNADWIERELEGNTGLRSMTWLEFTDGRVVFRGQMEWQDDGYRYGVESSGNRSSGRFPASAPLLGSVHLHNAVHGGAPGPWSGYYLPELRVDGASTCELVAPSASSTHPCLTCTAQPEPPGASAATEDADPTQPKATTLWFDVGPSQLSRQAEGTAGCSAQALNESAARVESLLVVTQGVWPSF